MNDWYDQYPLAMFLVIAIHVIILLQVYLTTVAALKLILDFTPCTTYTTHMQAELEASQLNAGRLAAELEASQLNTERLAAELAAAGQQLQALQGKLDRVR